MNIIWKWFFCLEMKCFKCFWKLLFLVDYLYLYVLGFWLMDFLVWEKKIRGLNYFFWFFFKFDKCWLIVYFIRVLWFRVFFFIWFFWILYLKLWLDLFIKKNWFNIFFMYLWVLCWIWIRFWINLYWLIVFIMLLLVNIIIFGFGFFKLFL